MTVFKQKSETSATSDEMCPWQAFRCFHWAKWKQRKKALKQTRVASVIQHFTQMQTHATLFQHVFEKLLEERWEKLHFIPFSSSGHMMTDFWSDVQRCVDSTKSWSGGFHIKHWAIRSWWQSKCHNQGHMICKKRNWFLELFWREPSMVNKLWQRSLWHLQTQLQIFSHAQQIKWKNSRNLPVSVMEHTNAKMPMPTWHTKLIKASDAITAFKSHVNQQCQLLFCQVMPQMLPSCWIDSHREKGEALVGAMFLAESTTSFVTVCFCVWLSTSDACFAFLVACLAVSEFLKLFLWSHDQTDLLIVQLNQEGSKSS